MNRSIVIGISYLLHCKCPFLTTLQAAKARIMDFVRARLQRAPTSPTHLIRYLSRYHLSSVVCPLTKEGLRLRLAYPVAPS
ncbi:hypothetical protein [Aliifodinibius sp. S!AR15-10]|uniref:hypothetical protein n=1 Tax=Aliifodinibius sp. S!AR15-10 TaxID=2950437 RepID=UPI002870AB9D|nr:hypothetical protein [Aliifodinibius sp. S!AR15-10]